MSGRRRHPPVGFEWARSFKPRGPSLVTLPRFAPLHRDRNMMETARLIVQKEGIRGLWVATVSRSRARAQARKLPRPLLGASLAGALSAIAPRPPSWLLRGPPVFASAWVRASTSSSWTRPPRPCATTSASWSPASPRPSPWSAPGVARPASPAPSPPCPPRSGPRSGSSRAASGGSARCRTLRWEPAPGRWPPLR